MRGRELLKADWIETPLGAMLAVADPHDLHLLEFFDRKALRGELSRLRERMGSSISFGRVAPITQIEAELRAYFAACSAAFSTVLARPGSPFTQRVWQELVGKSNRVRSMIGSSLTIREIATRLKVGKTTLYKALHRPTQVATETPKPR